MIEGNELNKIYLQRNLKYSSQYESMANGILPRMGSIGLKYYITAGRELVPQKHRAFSPHIRARAAEIIRTVRRLHTSPIKI